jgi:hypothetical protein
MENMHSIIVAMFSVAPSRAYFLLSQAPIPYGIGYYLTELRPFMMAMSMGIAFFEM